LASPGQPGIEGINQQSRLKVSFFLGSAIRLAIAVAALGRARLEDPAPKRPAVFRLPPDSSFIARDA
jgi:hypothetical protein